MNQPKTEPLIERFFKDKEGHWAIIQLPNLLLSLWIVLLIINLLVHSSQVKLLQTALIFTWAYLELTQGDSYFRRSLGAVVLAGVVVSFFL